MNPKRSNNEKLHTQQNTVTYSNDLNKLALFDFTKREQLLFFSIVSFLKDQGDKPVTITFQQMKDTFQATKTFAANDKDFTELLSGIMNKIFSRKITKPNGAILMVYLLTYHLVDPEDKTLTVKVNPDFEQAVLEGELSVKGRLRAAAFVRTAWRLFRDKNVRYVYRRLNRT